MPITDLPSVITVADEIYDHFTQVLIVVPTFKIGDTITQVVYRGEIDGTQSSLETVSLREAEDAAARALRWQTRTGLWNNCRDYRYAVRGRMPLSHLATTIPNLGRRDQNDRSFLDKANDTLNHWNLVNTALGADPLLLGGGTTRAQVATAYDTLVNGLENVSATTQALRAARADRDRLITALIDRMVQYRNSAYVALSGYPELRATIPIVWEHHEPDAVAVFLNGSWSAPDAAAMIDWTEAPEENFHSYRVRYRAGNEAPTSNDALLQTITDRTQTSLLASAMYTPAAPVWTFRVWVVTDSGNIAASNAVTVDNRT